MRFVKSILIVVSFSFALALFADEVDELIKKLGSDEWSEREAASKALAEKGETVVPALLKEYKKTEDFEVKSRIVTILDKLGYPSPEGMEKIEEIITDYEKSRFADEEEDAEEAEQQKEESEKKAKEKELKLLEELRKIKHSADYLVRLLATKTEVERRSKAVAELLSGLIGGGIGDIPGMKLNLPKKLGPGVKMRMKVVIVRGGKKKVVEVEDGKVVKGGGIDRNATPLTALIRTVKEAEDRRLRISAINALGLRGEKRAVSVLLKLLESNDDELRNAAAEALRKITGNDFGPYPDTNPEKVEEELQRWKEWWDANKDNEEYQLPKSRKQEDAESEVVPAEKELEKLLKRLERLRKRMTERKDAERKEQKKEKKEEKEDEKEDEDVGEF